MSFVTAKTKIKNLSFAQATRESSRLVRLASSPSRAISVLEDLEVLSTQFPEDVDMALNSLIAEEKTGTGCDIDERYTKLSQLAPNNLRVARFAARRLVKAQQSNEASKIVERATPLPADATPNMVRSRAELAHDCGLIDMAKAVFEAGLLSHPYAPDLHAAYAKRLRNIGSFREALEVMQRVEHLLKPETAKLALIEELEILVDSLPDDVAFEDERIGVMVALIRKYGGGRETPPAGPGKTCLITGSLAAAGAERQISRLGIELNRLSGFWGDDCDASHLGEVDVLVRSLVKKLGHEFFLAELEDADVKTEQIEAGHRLSARRFDEDTDPAARIPSQPELLANAPSLVRWSARELYPVLAGREYRTVSLWQDGAALFGALAALMANVPRIQIVFRGLPPNERTYLLKTEYEPLYLELAKLKGVDFMANSEVAARAYERWLGFSKGRVGVLPNGIVPPNSVGTEDDEAMWREFDARTGAGPIMGKVGRLDTVKRPVEWIRCAGAVARKRPDARFVILGDGRLRETCETEAERLGIMDRTLFVGHSQAVGYWLDHMDVLLMTSRFEGLPNVLIEAQSVGTAVVSTPAGGARECFLIEKTGKLLTCLETVDSDEVAAAISEVFDWSNTRGYDPSHAVKFARETYSVSAALAAYMGHCGIPEDEAQRLSILETRS